MGCPVNTAVALVKVQVAEAAKSVDDGSCTGCFYDDGSGCLNWDSKPSKALGLGLCYEPGVGGKRYIFAQKKTAVA